MRDRLLPGLGIEGAPCDPRSGAALGLLGCAGGFASSLSWNEGLEGMWQRRHVSVGGTRVPLLLRVHPPIRPSACVCSGVTV